MNLKDLRHDHHGCRLCVRQRAEAADEIERLREFRRQALEIYGDNGSATEMAEALQGAPEADR